MKQHSSRRIETGIFIFIIYLLILVSIIISSILFSNRYEETLIHAYGVRVESIAKSIAMTINITPSRIDELYQMDIAESRQTLDTKLFKEKVKSYLTEEIEYIYFEVYLPMEKVKYFVMENESEEYGVPENTPLRYFYVYTSEDESEYTDKMRFDVYNNTRQIAYETEDLVHMYFENSLWGRYITGYAPYFDDNGKFIGLLGVDVNADTLYFTLQNQKLGLFVIITILALALAVIMYHLYNSLNKAPYTDELTQLHNSNYIHPIVNKMLNKDHTNKFIGCIMMNIDGFKEINREYGYRFGDLVLAGTASLIKNLGKKKIVYIRTKDDEFLIIFTYNNNISPLDIYVKPLYELLKEYIVVDSIPILLSITSSVVLFEKNLISVDKLLEYLNYAMAKAKKSNRGSWEVFDHNRFTQFELRKDRLKAIPTILEKNLLYPVFQPIVDAKTGCIFGYEALSRCVHNLYINNIQSLVLDATSIGQQNALEKLMFKNIINYYQAHAHSLPNVKLFINESARNFFSRNEYKELFSRIDTDNIVIEITEYEEIDYSEIMNKIRALRSLSCKVALDDFGVGYSNIYTLLSVTPDIIKLDSSLIRDIDKDSQKLKMVGYIISYARDVNIKVLAEAVETSAELQCLLSLNVDYLQGYFLGRPDFRFKEVSEEARHIILDHISQQS